MLQIAIQSVVIAEHESFALGFDVRCDAFAPGVVIAMHVKSVAATRERACLVHEAQAGFGVEQWTLHRAGVWKVHRALETSFALRFGQRAYGSFERLALAAGELWHSRQAPAAGIAAACAGPAGVRGRQGSNARVHLLLQDSQGSHASSVLRRVRLAYMPVVVGERARARAPALVRAPKTVGQVQ